MIDYGAEEGDAYEQNPIAIYKHPHNEDNEQYEAERQPSVQLEPEY